MFKYIFTFLLNLPKNGYDELFAIALETFPRSEKCYLNQIFGYLSN